VVRAKVSEIKKPYQKMITEKVFRCVECESELEVVPGLYSDRGEEIRPIYFKCCNRHCGAKYRIEVTFHQIALPEDYKVNFSMGELK